MDKKKIVYTPSLFDAFKKEKKLELWDEFPVIMWGLGYEMDVYKSYEEYREHSQLKLKPAHSEREKRRNILYLLEHADRQIVGNYLFSTWRFYMHWSYGYNDYDVDFIWRVMGILETKYEEE